MPCRARSARASGSRTQLPATAPTSSTPQCLTSHPPSGLLGARAVFIQVSRSTLCFRNNQRTAPPDAGAPTAASHCCLNVFFALLRPCRLDADRAATELIESCLTASRMKFVRCDGSALGAVLTNASYRAAIAPKRLAPIVALDRETITRTTPAFLLETSLLVRSRPLFRGTRGSLQGHRLFDNQKVTL